MGMYHRDDHQSQPFMDIFSLAVPFLGSMYRYVLSWPLHPKFMSQASSPGFLV